MSDLISKARASLLATTDLNEQSLESILGQVMVRGADFADIYLQNIQEESWQLEDGIVKSSAFEIDRGFGLRVVSGERSGFAYADNIDSKSLAHAASSVKSIVKTGGQGMITVGGHQATARLYPDLDPLMTLNDPAKVALLQKIDQYLRRQDPRVKQVFASLSSRFEEVVILNHDGSWQADVRPLVSLRVKVIVEQKGRRESGLGAGGGRLGYELFTDDLVKEYCDKALRQALINLEAIPALAGLLPVVLGAGWPAVLLHEAIGHGLEGDHVRKQCSAFSDKLGERVASPICSIVDDGTIANKRGSLSVDDEGTVSQYTVLIENGVVTNFMQDKHNARLMQKQSTGNGRRESYAYPPVVRMTNTYMLPGKTPVEEIIASVAHGIYAVDFSGGQVDITSGDFVFTASEAYLIKDGKVAEPVKGATLIGNGLEVLHKISMVGDDLKLDSGIGSCGKEGQWVPVGVGQPTLKVDQLTVGGTR